MTLDSFLDFASDVTNKALPIVGFIALIFVILFIRHLIVLLKNTNDAVVSLKKTLDTANKELEALDKPLHTLNELSDTIDTVHEASRNAVRSALVTIIENLGAIKDWALNKGKSKEEPEVRCEDLEES